MINRIYRNKKLSVKIKVVDTIIQLRLQYYRSWFFGWENIGYRIDLELRDVGDMPSRLNPSTYHYNIGGFLELWDRAHWMFLIDVKKYSMITKLELS